MDLNFSIGGKWQETMDYFWFKPIQLEWVGQRKMEHARAGVLVGLSLRDRDMDTRYTHIQ